VRCDRVRRRTTVAEPASRVRRIEASPPLSREPRQRRTPAMSNAKRATGRTRHASVCPFSAERISAVDATSFWMLMSAPNAISASSAPILPAQAASRRMPSVAAADDCARARDRACLGSKHRGGRALQRRIQRINPHSAPPPEALTRTAAATASRACCSRTAH
jgi:hypothetical protein